MPFDRNNERLKQLAVTNLIKDLSPRLVVCWCRVTEKTLLLQVVPLHKPESVQHQRHRLHGGRSSARNRPANEWRCSLRPQEWLKLWCVSQFCQCPVSRVAVD